ncbi:MAG TPA: FtsX-like permease family protein [Streptosporangiaceae bacterium]|nr:FtsX-like permease family protein [Streptosporangiaceae bacterium]
MATVWLALRADVRRRWRALVSLALLLGLAGGVVLTAAAGARRTDTAYPRLLSWANAAQVEVTPGESDPAYFTALARLPQAAAVETVNQYTVALPVPHGTPDSQVQALSSPDGAYGASVDRVKIMAGRMFSPTAADEAVIDPQLARMEHLRPGDTLRLLGIPGNTPQGPSLKSAFPLQFRVTAVAVFDNQVVPVTATNSLPLVLFSPGFTRTSAANKTFYLAEGGVRLRPGVDPAAFITTAKAVEKRYPQAEGDFTVFVNLSSEITSTERGIRPEAVALAVFAALAGLIALAVLGQLLARQLALDSAEFPVLRAVGMTRRSLLALSATRLALVTVAGGVLAVAIAVAASPLMPIGSAGLAEPDPGIQADAAVLVIGFAVIAALPLALLARPAWRAVSHAMGPLGVAEPAPGRTRPSVLAATLASAGPVTSGIGVRMALEPGRGRTAVPVRSALAGTVVAIAALVAAAIFGASLTGLVGTPGRYGQNWDAELNTGFAAVPASFAARVISAVPGVARYAEGSTGQLSVDGQIVPAIGIDQPSGSAGQGDDGGYLTMLGGRAPADQDEIALGAQTLRALHARLGQTVRVAVTLATGIAGPRTERTMRVVGVTVFPDFGLQDLSDTDLGTGAVVSPALLSSIQPNTGCVQGVTCYDFFLLRYRPGTDTSAAADRLLAAVAADGCPFGACMVTSSQQPGDIRDYAAISGTPLALGAVLAVLAVGTLAHVLLTGVRRRRRDVAVLKTLGFTRSQVHGVVAWEATALAVAALLIGIPVGVIAGRWAWALFANAAGVASQATVNVPLVLLAIPVTLLLANVIAAWPGWTAARLRPAQVLRTE